MQTKKKLAPFITVIVALAGLAALLGAQSNPNAGRGDGQHLEGSWHLTVALTGVPPGFVLEYKSLITFAPDGGVVQTAWAPPVPPAFINIIGVSPWIGHGEWARTGNRQFALTVLIPRFNGTGGFIGLAKARASIKLNESLRDGTGSFRGELFDAAGNTLIPEYGGSLFATRLEVEPIE